MKRSLRGLSAQSVVELALLLPVLLLLVLGTLDLGRAFYYQEAIANVAREGARYGAIRKNASSAEISSKALQEAGSLGSEITVTNVTRSATATNKYVEVSISYQFDLITPLMENVAGGDIVLKAKSRMPSPANSSS